MHLKILEKKLNYFFKNRALLVEALTHPSMKKSKNYQRLEFLGNSILGAILADIVYSQFSQLNEGKLSIILSKMASTNGIVTAIAILNLGEYLILDRGEEKNSGRQNIKNIEDCCEAIIGAIYIDGGYQPVKNFVKMFWSNSLRSIENLTHRDPKSQLQELCQKNGYALPFYSVVKISGPAHAPAFTIRCLVNTGEKSVDFEVISKTKREGESESAKKVLELLKLY